MHRAILRSWGDYFRRAAYSCGASDRLFGFLRLLPGILDLLLIFFPEVVVEIQKLVLSFQITVSLLLGIIVGKLFISDLLPSSSDRWTSKCCEYLRSLLLPLPPLAPPLRLPLPHGLSVSHLSLSHLIAEVHGGKSIHQAVLVLETLLSHVQSFLHRHCESYTEGKNEAGK